MLIEFHREAAHETEAATNWYAERSPAAAIRFLAELDVVIHLIESAPQRWPLFEADTRRVVLRKFPYSVIYAQRAEGIVVVAVAHARRQPGYWKGRLT